LYGEEKYLSLQKIKFIVVGSGKLLKIIQNKGSEWDDSYQFFMKLHLIDPPQPHPPGFATPLSKAGLFHSQLKIAGVDGVMG
jgi:hypothetical protein